MIRVNLAKKCQTVEMRQLLAAGHTERVVGDLYGVEQTVVNALARGRTWKHVPFPAEEPT